VSASVDEIAALDALSWVEIADSYDDGGLSGGTLERPALQRLLADVASGRIDIIVV
jgi:site-specific DNA recombinase